MTVSFELPSDLQAELQLAFGDLGQAAKEALAVRGYTERKYGMSTLRRLLGLETRWDLEQWLTEHHIERNYSADDLQADIATLRSLRS
jgi:predicted HTH domain antitoxin